MSNLEEAIVEYKNTNEEFIRIVIRLVNKYIEDQQQQNLASLATFAPLRER